MEFKNGKTYSLAYGFPVASTSSYPAINEAPECIPLVNLVIKDKNLQSTGSFTKTLLTFEGEATIQFS